MAPTGGRWLTALSDMCLLSGPRETFRARFGFASLAEKSLDLQYFLWKGDLTGRLLLYRALQSTNHTTVHSHYMKWHKRLIEAGAELYELRPDPELLEHFKEVESRIAEAHAGLHTKVINDNYYFPSTTIKIPVLIAKCSGW